MAENAAPQRKEFQTEAKQLLHLMIHSLYSHKEVFLRELISNASDALDKLRFEAVTTPTILGDDAELKINISLDKTGKIITLSDNGIGMTWDEVIENIGTIARSGSKKFVEKLTGDQKADSNLIGQFGVGFYSVFMVANKVKLVTKRAGSDGPAVAWESDGVSDYTMAEATKESRGTDVIIYLRDEEGSFAEEWQVKSLVKKYSDFIAFPIYLPNDKGTAEIVNQTKPLWKRANSDVTEQQYEDFYRQVCGGFDKPMVTLHNRAEGVMEYSSLLFVPEKAAFDLYRYDHKHGVKLYVKRVFIMDDCKELLPEYLRFVKGVVDSEDLPLNVSREMLQHNPMIDKIRKTLVGKVLARLTEMAETESDKYKTFWLQYGPVFKEGVASDYENHPKLIDLLRFQSTMGTKDDLTSLKQYVSRMREDQKEIYYITGENRDIAEKSPHLEIFTAKSIEVLYLVDPVDEFILPHVLNYEGKQLKSITKGDLDLGELGKEEKKEQKKVESKLKKLTERIKNILAGDVKEVRCTFRLKDSPCCLVTDEKDMGAYMERLMKSMGQEVPESKRILEINPEHPIVVNLNALYEKEPTSTKLDEWVHLLFDQAIIAEGQMVRDPQAYTKRVYELLKGASAVN